MSISKWDQYDTRRYNDLLRNHLERQHTYFLEQQDVRELRISRGSCKMDINCVNFFKGLQHGVFIRPSATSYHTNHASNFTFNNNDTDFTFFGKEFFAWNSNQATVYALFGLQLTHLYDYLTRITLKATVGLQDLGWKLLVLRKVIDDKFKLCLGLEWAYNSGYTLSTELNRAVFGNGRSIVKFMVTETGHDGIHAETTLPVGSHLLTTEFDFGFSYGLGLSGKSEVSERKQWFWTLKANTAESLLAEFGVYYVRSQEETDEKFMLAYTSSLNSGIMIRLGYFRDKSSFHFPLTVATEHSLESNFLAFCVPVAFFGLLKFIHRVKWSKHEAKEEEDEEHIKARTERELRRVAKMQQQLMKNRSLSNVAAEEKQDGLVIVQAKLDDFDVTIPMRYLVKNSKLNLHSGSKHNLPGFYGKEDSTLTIDYTFDGNSCSCSTRSTFPVVLPSEAHRERTD